MLGELLYKSKSYQQSIDALIELNNSFFAYEQWVGEGFLLIADNYMELGEYYQAKGTLNSIKDDFPLEDIRNRAETKLKKVEALEAAQNQLEKEDTVENEG